MMPLTLKLRDGEWLNDAYSSNRTQVVAIVLCSAAVNVLYLAPSLFMMQVYDRVLTSGNMFTLFALSVVLVLALLTLATLDAMRSRLLAHIGRRLDRQFGYQILDRAMNDRAVSGNSALREFDRLRGEATGATATAVLDAPWALLFVSACFLIHPAVGFTALASAATLIGLAVTAGRTLSGPTSKQSAELARSYARQDADAGLGDVARALGMTDRLITRQQAARSDVLHAQGRTTRIATLFTAATRTFRMFSQSASLIVAAILAINQEVSVGAIIAVSILTARALAPIEQIVGLWRNFGQLRHAFTVVSEVLKPSAVHSYLPLPAPRGAVTVDGVTQHITLPGERFVPYRGDNPLLTNQVVLFPSTPTEYGDVACLVTEIAAYVRKYVDLTPTFEKLAVEYVLFTWVYDRFRELPYLRLHGEYGSGKTRFLQVVGAICRTPIFAGGASTVSPLFHLLDRFHGTLILDEADFRFSDERAQLVKILNNGNVRGFPVLRSESVNGKEYRPVAYQVYGPKIVAMRGEFEDRALESRFISERSDGRMLRSDIPLNLPEGQAEEALALRNKLLMYRFRRFVETGTGFVAVDRTIEPRLNQVFAPLLANIEDTETREALRAYARARNRTILDERGTSMEAQLLAVLRHLHEHSDQATLALRDIADLYGRAFAVDTPQPPTPRAVGGIMRKRLGLRPQKSHGVYVLSTAERAKLPYLFDRYSVMEDDAAHIATFDLKRTLELTFEPIDSPPR